MRGYSVNTGLLTYIRQTFGDEEIFRQAGEEGGEFTQASLKYLRSQRGTTPTPLLESKANLLSEVADVLNCIDMYLDMGLFSEEDIYNEKDAKMRRWYERAVNFKKTGHV